jgi:hypothetical protein
VIACRNSSKNASKIKLQPIMNKNSPQTNIESKIDMLGVAGKLVKYVIYLSKRKKLKKKTAND